MRGLAIWVAAAWLISTAVRAETTEVGATQNDRPQFVEALAAEVEAQGPDGLANNGLISLKRKSFAESPASN